MGAARLLVPSIRVVLLGAALILARGSVARAQDAAGPPPAHISFVEGTALAGHDGEWETAVVNLPLGDGDRVRTTEGRAQVVLPDGTAIDIDPYSEIVFLTASRIRVAAGSIERHEAEDAETDATAAAYLPQELQMYGDTFGQYGSWENEAPYGAVWYPRVARTWRPYYHGYWAPTPSYGWTWVGFDAWDWPTHHYGRWGYARGSWFWVPGRVWAPAWVSWASAPGLVGWCPLGVNGSSVFALSIGSGDPWTGWTIVRRDTFGGRGYAVHRYAVDPHDLTRATPFIIQSRAPVALSAAASGPLPVAAPPRSFASAPGAAGLAVQRDRTVQMRAAASPPPVRHAAPAGGRSRAVEDRPPSVTPPSDRAPIEPRAAATPRAVPGYATPAAAPRSRASGEQPAADRIPRVDRPPATATHAEAPPPAAPPSSPTPTEPGAKAPSASSAPAAAPHGAPPSPPARGRPVPPRV
jgi:hypothetical protein